MYSVVSNVFRFTRQQVQGIISTQQFHALPTTIGQNATSALTQTTSNIWSLDVIRNIIRNNFPKASERKRVKKHGWKKRLSTKNGRRIIMRRILKGCFVLSH